MGEGHCGKGQSVFGGGEDGGRETEGAADDEGEIAGAGESKGVQAGGESLRREPGAADVEDDEVAGGPHGLQYPLPFPVEDAGLVGRRRIIGHFLLRRLDDVEAAEGG